MKPVTRAGLTAYEGQDYPGVDVAFFTRHGGASADKFDAQGRLIGIYAGLNAGSAGQDNQSKVRENFTRAARFMVVDIGNLVLLESQYGNGVIAVDAATQGLPNEAGVRKLKGDALMTDDPSIALGIVGADAHPIVIKARKAADGTPVVALVVGSNHGLLRGVLNNTLETMVERYGIDKNSVAVDIGPGLGPTSIKDKNGRSHTVQPDRFSSTSYEIGIRMALDFIEGKTNKDALPDNPYPYMEPGNTRALSLQDFDYYAAKGLISPDLYQNALMGGADNPVWPLFTVHPFDDSKIVMDTESFVVQSLALSGITAHQVKATGLDTFDRTADFFSARGLEGKLNIQGIAEARGMTVEELGRPENRGRIHAHIGRNLMAVSLNP